MWGTKQQTINYGWTFSVPQEQRQTINCFWQFCISTDHLQLQVQIFPFTRDNETIT